jgi:hypothetical protein
MERPVGSLHFQCPNTKGDIPSGIMTDEASAKLVAELPVTLVCPCCQQVHRIKVRDGQFGDNSDAGLGGNDRGSRVRAVALHT